MSNIKELKKRLHSVQGTLKITTAMKLVATSKFSRAKEALENAKPYVAECQNIVTNMLMAFPEYTHPYLKVNSGKRRDLIVVFSTDKGLCGSYNHRIADLLKSFENHHYNNTIDYCLWGEKVLSFYSIEKEKVFKKVEFHKDTTFELIVELIDEIEEVYTTGKYDRVFLAYNYFHSALHSEPTIIKFLPFNHPAKDHFSGMGGVTNLFNYSFDEDPYFILDNLIKDLAMASFNLTLLHAQASEHGSRMFAMESASDNCQELIKNLTIKMNKARHAANTTELTEIVSGAESLDH